MFFPLTEGAISFTLRQAKDKLVRLFHLFYYLGTDFTHIYTVLEARKIIKQK